MGLKNRVSHCAECEFMKMYDYTYKNYYCDHEARTDDMGKLSVDHPPKTSPVWCPLREKEIIIPLILSDIHLADKDGCPLEVKSFQPEYLDRV